MTLLLSCAGSLWTRRIAFTAALALASASNAAEQASLIAAVSGDAPAQVVFIDPETLAASPQGECLPEARPAWSADGATLVYEAPAGEGRSSAVVLRVDAEGSASPEPLTTAFAHNRNPAASPDGAMVAYEAYDTAPEQSAIAVWNSATGREEVWGGGRRMLYEPVWLPNAKLLLSIDPSRKIEIPGVDIDAVRRETGLLDGTALQGGPPPALFCTGFDSHDGKLTSELLLVTRTQILPVLALVPDGPDSRRYSEWRPAISPGGTRVIFESDLGGDRELFMLDLNGLVNLTNHHAADWNPVWARDGRWIAFETFRDDRRDIYRTLVETLRTEKVMQNAWGASWSPDGKRLACVTLRDGKPAVVVKEVEGAGEKALAGLSAWAPAWRPKP